MRAPERSYTSSAPPLSLPITADREGSIGLPQMAGSSAASPERETGVVLRSPACPRQAGPTASATAAHIIELATTENASVMTTNPRNRTVNACRPHVTFPFEWGSGLASATGRLAPLSGLGDGKHATSICFDTISQRLEGPSGVLRGRAADVHETCDTSLNRWSRRSPPVTASSLARRAVDAAWGESVRIRMNRALRGWAATR